MKRASVTYLWAVASMLLCLCPLHAAQDANLVQNGSFERGAGGWGSIADLPGNELDVTHLAITQRPVYLVSEKSRPGKVPW